MRLRRWLSSLAAPVVLAVVAAGCATSRTEVAAEARPAATTTSMCAHLPPEQGGCGPSWEEQVSLNRRYADRLDFSGDVGAAAAVADEVWAALEPLADVRPAPPVDDVRAALARWDPGVQVADNAVRTAGTAFAVPVDGGCVFGSIWEGVLEIEIGGYIHDGGCLATYAH